MPGRLIVEEAARGLLAGGLHARVALAPVLRPFEAGSGLLQVRLVGAPVGAAAAVEPRLQHRPRRRVGLPAFVEQGQGFVDVEAVQVAPGEAVAEKLGNKFQASDSKIEFAKTVYVPVSSRSWLVKLHGKQN